MSSQFVAVDELGLSAGSEISSFSLQRRYITMDLMLVDLNAPLLELAMIFWSHIARANASSELNQPFIHHPTTFVLKF
jgi:hypothetical protein